MFYKIYKFPFLISILYQYSDTYVQIYIVNTIGIFFNRAIAGDTNYIAGSALAFIGIVFGIMLVQSFTAIYIDLEKQKKKYKFKRYLYEEFLDSSLSRVEKLTTGEIITRLEKDVDKVIYALDGSWGIIIAAGISSITYVVYMGKISITSAVIIFVMGCLPFLSQIILKNAFTRTYDGYYKTEDDIAAHIKEMIDGFEHIKLYNMYSRMEKIYYNLQKKTGKCAMAVEKAFITGKSMNEGLSSIAKFGMYGLLGYFLYKGMIKTGDVVQMALISKKLFVSLQSIFEQYQNLTETEVAIERLDEMISVDEEREKSSGQNIEDIEKIDVKGITFKYGEKPILKDADFSIKKGEKVLIIGPNGSGKSTITKIILGLYMKYTGQVSINGISINCLNLKRYRNLIAWIPQDQYFYPGDAAENLAIFSDEFKGLSECAAAFEIDEDMLQGRPCDNLSGGQRQRISLIRGLSRGSNLIILDEPSNYLDAKAVDSLKKFIKESEKTIIAITHDEKLIDVFDRICRLEDGRFVEVRVNEK